MNESPDCRVDLMRQGQPVLPNLRVVRLVETLERIDLPRKGGPLQPTADGLPSARREVCSRFGQ